MSKGKLITTFKIENQTYSIRATNHAQKRMKERKVDKYAVSGDILALGKEKLEKLSEQSEETIIIDEEKDISVVIGFNKNKVKIITVIDKSNVFVKKGTVIEKI